MTQDTINISLCMIVRNEASNLGRCLESVQGAVDEIVVVDTGSTDDTVSIARSHGAKVIKASWEGDFAKARNAGLQHARGTWILFMDADEELDSSDVGELLLCARHLDYEGFFLQIHNHVSDDIRSVTATVNPILRMFRRRPEHRFRGRIHEQIAASITERCPEARLHISNVKIHHYGYSAGMVTAKDKISRNMELLRLAIEDEPEDPFHHYNMAVEFMRLNQQKLALHHLCLAKRYAAPEISYYHLLFKYEARTLLSLGRSEEAMEACAAGLLLFPDYTDLIHLKGVIQLSAGRLPEADETLRAAFGQGPAPPHYHTETGAGTYLSSLALGQVNEQLGDDEQALYWYGQTLRIGTGMRLALNRIILIMKANLREKDIPAFLNRFKVSDTCSSTMSVADRLLRYRCYDAAHHLLLQTRSTCASNDEYKQLIRISERMSESRSKRYSGISVSSLQPSQTADMNAALSEEKQIENMYYSGQTGQAIEAIHAMTAYLSSSPGSHLPGISNTPGRLLTSFAESQLLQTLMQPMHQNIQYAILRKAICLLPQFDDPE